MICEANEWTNDKTNVDDNTMARMYMVVVFFQNRAETRFSRTIILRGGKETSPLVF